jgi:hypothetical protein
MSVQIFPTSNFDQSAITPVFLGTVVSWVLTETLGWVFAGLVVSGYLATLLVLEPRSAAIDIGEAVLTYGIARVFGEHLSRTGLTSRVFGRERFLLVVLVSILVRVGVEGVVFPEVVPRATWAYSIGLVVVPLAANSCWKTGLWRGAIRTAVPTAVVYSVVRFVLLPHTNLSLAWFQLANEDIAASFLASPRAYLLLVTGAVLGAAANLRYGWDYNGILLPALLALAVDSPSVLVATLIEIVALLCVMHVLLRWTPIGRWNIEGPRRLTLFFTAAYALRFGFAALLGPDLSRTGFVQASGFGYLLPALLAVKISQKGLASVVLLPTAAVSVAAFGLGNALGFAAERMDGSSGAATHSATREVARAPADPTHAALWLSALARSGEMLAPRTEDRPAAWLGELAESVAGGEQLDVPDDIVVERLDGGVWLLRERFEDEQLNSGTPSVLIAPEPARKRVVALIEQPLSAPETAAIGGELVRAGLLDVAVIAGVESEVQGVSADPKARATARYLAHSDADAYAAQGAVIVLRRGTNDALQIAASERARSEPRIAAVAAALGNEVRELASAFSANREPEDVVIEVPRGYAGPWLESAEHREPARIASEGQPSATAAREELAELGSSARDRQPLGPIAGAAVRASLRSIDDGSPSGTPARALATQPLSLISASARAMAVSALPDATRPPTLEDRIALRRLVLAPLLSGTTATSALKLIRESAWTLGYELLGPAATSDGDRAVVLRPRSATAAVALIARLQKRSGLVVEAPFGTRDTLRGFAVSLGDRLDADIVLIGLDPVRGALFNTVFAEAHAAALAPSLEREQRVVAVRSAALDANSASAAEVARWGGEAAEVLAARCTGALAQLGVEGRAGTLDPVTREHAGRNVFGRTPLVAITVDASLLQRPLLARAEPLLEDFTGFEVVDAECASLAAKLAGELPDVKAPAPARLRELARRAAVERSVIARRALEQVLAKTRSKAAIARASRGIFLVVAGARSHQLTIAAYPLALALGVETAAPPLRSPSVHECASTLDHGGACIIEQKP